MRALRISGLVAPCVLLAIACSPSVQNTNTTTPTPTPVASPTPPANTGDHITSNVTWTGAMNIANPTTIDPGVTVTVTSGAQISIAPAAPLYIQGTLIVNGLMANPAVFDSNSPPSAWGGFVVQVGGTATVKYATIRHAAVGVKVDQGALLSKWIGVTLDGIGVPISAADSVKFCRLSEINACGDSNFTGGTITFFDSLFDGGNSGDITNFSGSAALDVEHSHMGTNWHCLIHGMSSAPLTIKDSILENAAYSFMVSNLSGTVSGSKIQGITSNFISGSGNTINAQQNYWGMATCPTVGGGIDSSNCVTTSTDPLVVNAGPRSSGAGCESDPSF